MSSASLPIGTVIQHDIPPMHDTKCRDCKWAYGHGPQPWLQLPHGHEDLNCREGRSEIAIVRGYDISHSKYHVSPQISVSHPADVMSSNEITLRFHPAPLSWAFPGNVTVPYWLRGILDHLNWRKENQQKALR